MKNLSLVFIALVSSFYATTSLAKEEKLKSIYEELVVNVSIEEAWQVINSYGDVGSYHSGVTTSKPINGSQNEGAMGCERQCFIEGKKDITVDEKIIEFVDGSHYRYAAHSDDFPAKAFYNTFGVKQNEEGKTIIYVRTEYQLNNGLLTAMAKGQLRKGNVDALLFYKHYMETGEKNANADIIRNTYK